MNNWSCPDTVVFCEKELWVHCVSKGALTRPLKREGEWDGTTLIQLRKYTTKETCFLILVCCLCVVIESFRLTQPLTEAQYGSPLKKNWGRGWSDVRIYTCIYIHIYRGRFIYMYVYMFSYSFILWPRFGLNPNPYAITIFDRASCAGFEPELVIHKIQRTFVVGWETNVRVYSVREFFFGTAAWALLDRSLVVRHNRLMYSCVKTCDFYMMM